MPASATASASLVSWSREVPRSLPIEAVIPMLAIANAARVMKRTAGRANPASPAPTARANRQLCGRTRRINGLIGVTGAFA